MCLWCAEKLNWNKINRTKKPDLRILIFDGNQMGRFRCTFEGTVVSAQKGCPGQREPHTKMKLWVFCASQGDRVTAVTAFYTVDLRSSSFLLFFFLKVIKTIEKISVWRETRLINSKWIRSVPGSQICTQIKNKTLQTQGLKSSSVKHLSWDAYLGLVFLSEARFCLKIISNRWGYQNCQHVTNWWENPVS